MTFAIKRIRPLISLQTAKQLYFAHIQSHLLYKQEIKNSIIIIIFSLRIRVSRVDGKKGRRSRRKPLNL
jgi:hypothetical protein